MSEQAPGSLYDPIQARLERYAEDIQTLFRRERDTRQQFKALVAQLEAYTVDLRKVLATERERAQELERSYHDTIGRLSRAASFRDDETQAHADRLGLYVRALGEGLGMPEDEMERLSVVAPMHDLGKIGIPDSILLKPGPLTEDEWSVMRRHPAIGASLLKASPSPLIEMARLVSLTHHEAWDGSGYPQGLAGDAIPLVGRIVKLVDVYDALRSPRPYKPPVPHAETVRILVEGDGRTLPSHFDPTLLEVFVRVQHRLAEIYEAHCDQ